MEDDKEERNEIAEEGGETESRDQKGGEERVQSVCTGVIPLGRERNGKDKPGGQEP